VSRAQQQQQQHLHAAGCVHQHNIDFFFTSVLDGSLCNLAQ
jgi:hypothetical protein